MPRPTPADGPCASFNGTGCTLSARSRSLNAPACRRAPWHPQVALGILKRMGCVNVVTAENGEQAVAAVQAAGGPDAFDVILMDLHMPLKARAAAWGVWGEPGTCGATRSGQGAPNRVLQPVQRAQRVAHVLAKPIAAFCAAAQRHLRHVGERVATGACRLGTLATATAAAPWGAGSLAVRLSAGTRAVRTQASSACAVAGSSQLRAVGICSAAAGPALRPPQGGREAVRIVRTHAGHSAPQPAAHYPPPTALPLPDTRCGLQGGMEAVRDIRTQWPRYATKIIAVTADAFEDTRDNCIANGFDGW